MRRTSGAQVKPFEAQEGTWLSAALVGFQEKSEFDRLTVREMGGLYRLVWLEYR
jgi:hypothetical protein